LNDRPDALPDAFLSYTRIDDQFYGGAITSFRKLLELGVKVVTGRVSFSIFQDVDGTEIGEQFQQRFDEVIAGAWFFIPIITPLFFNSTACRGELEKFLVHEKTLGRNDLILPVYYVTAPVLEKPDLLANDPLATEIHARQRYDWRAQADLPIDDPKIRAAVKNLAEKIAAALARTQAPPATTEIQRSTRFRINRIAPSNPDTGETGPSESTKDLDLRAASNTVKQQEPEPQPKEKQRTILWVDDNPDNNIFERHAMEAYNIGFELAKSTDEALAKLKQTKFDAIISDMGRPPDSRAGYTLLKAVRDGGDETPYFIFSAASTPAFEQEALRRKAQGSTNISETLIAKVLEHLNQPSTQP
jgi:CheY-like chemotaxis protein